jgi:phosphonate transport system ATP-binding protein
MSMTGSATLRASSTCCGEDAPGRAPFAFTVEAVSVQYRGNCALDRVTLHIASGEAVAIVGPSGAGKTTLLRLLNGSVCPSKGTVKVAGRSLADLTAEQLRCVRSSIGFVHQDLRLVPNLRVVQNVIAGRLGTMSLLRSMSALLCTPRPLINEAYEILECVGIPEKLYERTDRLSGGQRQRVAIARALFQRPIALIADEPVSSVDPARARDAVALLASVCKQRGITLCVSLHNLELARTYFPRLVGIRQGRIMFDRPTAVLKSHEFDSLYHLDASEMLRDGV